MTGHSGSAQDQDAIGVSRKAIMKQLIASQKCHANQRTDRAAGTWPEDVPMRRCRASCSDFVGRPRLGVAGVNSASAATVTDFTCSPSQLSTSSTRQSSRFVPGKRQTGGKDCGFLVASLRILATDLRRHAASWSTVRSACMEMGPFLRHVTFVPKAVLICAHPCTGSTSQSHPIRGPY